MALAQRILLVTGMTLCAGSAAAMSSTGVTHARASGAEVSGAAQAEGNPAPFHVPIIERSRDLSPDAFALECEEDEEELDVEREPAHDAPLVATPTSLRRPCGSGTPFIVCDTVGSHAARGPPAG